MRGQLTPERLQREVQLLQRRFEKVGHDGSGAWILLSQVPLPAGWDRSSTDVLVVIPPGYPATPPDNFFVPVGFRLNSGQSPSNYSESQTINGTQWGQFSFHAQEWNPAASIEDGDNLSTFMVAVTQRLSEVN